MFLSPCKAFWRNSKQQVTVSASLCEFQVVRVQNIVVGTLSTVGQTEACSQVCAPLCVPIFFMWGSPWSPCHTNSRLSSFALFSIARAKTRATQNWTQSSALFSQATHHLDPFGFIKSRRCLSHEAKNWLRIRPSKSTARDLSGEELKERKKERS